MKKEIEEFLSSVGFVPIRDDVVRHKTIGLILRLSDVELMTVETLFEKICRDMFNKGYRRCGEEIRDILG